MVFETINNEAKELRKATGELKESMYETLRVQENLIDEMEKVRDFLLKELERSQKQL